MKVVQSFLLCAVCLLQSAFMCIFIVEVALGMVPILQIRKLRPKDGGGLVTSPR